jgi:hypothetical protein
MRFSPEASLRWVGNALLARGWPQTSRDCISCPGSVSGESWLRLPLEVGLRWVVTASPTHSRPRVSHNCISRPRLASVEAWLCLPLVVGLERVVIVSPARGWPRASCDLCQATRFLSTRLEIIAWVLCFDTVVKGTPVLWYRRTCFRLMFGWCISVFSSIMTTSKKFLYFSRCSRYQILNNRLARHEWSINYMGLIKNNQYALIGKIVVQICN